MRRNRDIITLLRRSDAVSSRSTGIAKGWQKRTKRGPRVEKDRTDR